MSNLRFHLTALLLGIAPFVVVFGTIAGAHYLFGPEVVIVLFFGAPFLVFCYAFGRMFMHALRGDE